VEDQIPADALTTYKVAALARLACPDANIPCTSALATLHGQDGRILALQRGANVIMPNLTPNAYRRRYQIYPDKAGSQQTPAENDAAVKKQILAAGRQIGRGHGFSPNFRQRGYALPVT
jgi:biotin synthase